MVPDAVAITLSEADLDAVAKARSVAAGVLDSFAAPVPAALSRPAQVHEPKDLAPLIENTILAPHSSWAEVRTKCTEAVRYGFHGVCVNPRWVPLVAKEVRRHGVAIVSVVGFPLGANETAVKVEEAQRAVSRGATEIDMVGDLGALASGDLTHFAEEIRAVVSSVPGVPVKVIVECGILNGVYERALAAALAERAGAAFVKTSTGFAYARHGEGFRSLGATLEDVRVLMAAVSGRIGVKASGGISSYTFARDLVAAGASRIGTSSGPRLVDAEGY